MNLTRRALLKTFSAAGAAAAAGGSKAFARDRKVASDDAVGMLYDATKCIGCKTCMVACKKENGLADESPNGLWEAPVDLSGKTKNIIKLCRDGNLTSYVKAQCMHCVDPACVSVCMLGALHKASYGVVEYDASKCIGCRYCQVACPFNVPKFEWTSALPKIVKCEMCKDRLKKGQEPACTEVCPTKAVIFGKRSTLLAEAKKRIKESPEKYVPKVYGETDAGGTQVLYLSALPFDKLGLPMMGDKPVPAATETIQHAVYKGFIAPVALYALLGGVLFRNRGSKAAAKPDQPNKSEEVQP
jgi:Fe-S-cluster-containing dehydrogenase component